MINCLQYSIDITTKQSLRCIEHTDAKLWIPNICHNVGFLQISHYVLIGIHRCFKNSSIYNFLRLHPKPHFLNNLTPWQIILDPPLCCCPQTVPWTVVVLSAMSHSRLWCCYLQCVICDCDTVVLLSTLHRTCLFSITFACQFQMLLLL